MLTRSNYTLAIICLLLAGCTQSSVRLDADGQPDWIHGRPSDYPDSSYLSATGSASKVEMAKDRALANLAKIFELQVREDSTTTQDVQTHKSDGIESVQASARIASTVNVYTSKLINGARIAEQWQHPADLTHYALAVLDRAQAGNNVRGEIDRLDREIAFTMTNAETQANELKKVAALQSAIVMQAERNTLQKTLKILDLEGRGKPSSWNLAGMKAQQLRSLQALNMRAIVLGDSVGELDELIQGAMATAGFQSVSGEQAYTLSASMETQEALRKQGWYWLRGTLKLRLVDPEGVVLGNKSWPLKVSSQQQNQLYQRMQDEIDKKLKSELKSTILGFATGEA
jgi:hypothetical protein